MHSVSSAIPFFERQIALRAHKCMVLLKTILSVSLVSTPVAFCSDLRIELVQGDGAIHNVSSRHIVEPVIRLLGEAGQPITGGHITFLTPEFGPGGRFASSGNVFTTTTDAQGLATGRGLRPNQQTGQWEIRIAASYGGQKTRTSMQQTNAAPPGPLKAKGKSSTKWILAIAAGGAAAGLAAALGGGGTPAQPSSPPPAAATPAAIPTTITAAAGSLGRP